jgi:hypothetical protein
MICQWFGLKTTVMVSPSLASKPVATVSSSLASKSVDSGFSVWASKLAATVCQWFYLKTTGTVFQFELQNRQLRFVSGLGPKPLGRVSPFGPQN